MEEQVLEASRHYPVVMLGGQRQVGKSTMLNHIREPGRRYVSLDDGNARRLAINDPALFFETYGYPLLIDEFQRAPSILLEMKNIVDQKALSGEDNNGMFWLTGSQRFRMMKDVPESLAGRIAVFDMSSLSSAEIEGRPADVFHPDLRVLTERMKHARQKTVHQVYADIFRGAMPRLHSSTLDRDRFYMDYVNTYIERDIRDLAKPRKFGEFYDFLVYMAARSGQELKYSDIANSIGVSAPTARAWVSILESSGVIFMLRPYYSNITKRLVKTPKVYFLDTGLAAYLCRWPNAATLENGAMDGAFFETYAVSEIVKSYLNAGKAVDLYYYRDIDKKEIDLLIIEGDRIYPIEIKKSKQPSRPDRNFGVLQKFHLDVQPGVVLCMSDELIPYKRDVWYCPISVL
ncbi:MAG: ATP-binding protein [Bacillota bacterium]|nr:ATP-binding protein [Bacillota bacterium]